MNRRRHIRAIDEHRAVESPKHVAEPGERDSLELSDDYLADDSHDELDELENGTLGPSFGWIFPATALLAVVGWTGFFAWINRDGMLGYASAQQWSAWITSWAVPVLLVLAVWLLARRSSTREARRFGHTAEMLSRQSAELESRLKVINRELSLAREFLGAQSRDLEFFGRSASETIGEHAATLQSLIADNGARIESIASVSSTALENMEKLRNDLPVIANSSRDVSNQIGNAGRTAKGQLAELVAGFERLNEFGSASEIQVESLQKRIEEALDTMRVRSETLRDQVAALHGEAVDEESEALELIRVRIAALRDEAATTSSAIREGEVEATSAWNAQIEEIRARLKAAIEEVVALDERALENSNRKLQDLAAEAESIDARLAERNTTLAVELAKRRTEIENAHRAAMIATQERLTALDRAIEERRRDQLEKLAELVAQGETLGDRIDALGAQIDRAAAQGADAGDTLAARVETLDNTLSRSRETIGSTGEALSGLTDASVRLLELIQASAKHSKDDLPVAIADFENRLNEVEGRTEAVRDLLDAAADRGAALSETLAQTHEGSAQVIADIDRFRERLAGSTVEQHAALTELSSLMSALDDDNRQAAERAQGELREAIAALETSARDALATLEADKADRIRAIADRVGSESAEAIGKAVEEQTAQSLGELDSATRRSSEATREAARRMTEQLTKVNELASNLEARVAHARERAEQQVDNDFARRVALITESLNSNAIDIGKALSSEVADTAWTAYLRGDRGIFTRRAVRLLDNTEAREVAELYDGDPDFREHVSRYIHDFEAMLRTLLSTRDGNAVSVTLLSSDMGKLYVALAQAIERLRD